MVDCNLMFIIPFYGRMTEDADETLSSCTAKKFVD